MCTASVHGLEGRDAYEVVRTEYASRRHTLRRLPAPPCARTNPVCIAGLTTEETLPYPVQVPELITIRTRFVADSSGARTLSGCRSWPHAAGDEAEARVHASRSPSPDSIRRRCGPTTTARAHGLTTTQARGRATSVRGVLETLSTRYLGTGYSTPRRWLAPIRQATWHRADGVAVRPD